MTDTNYNWLYLRGSTQYTDERYREITNMDEGQEIITEAMLHTPEINHCYISRSEDPEMAQAKINKWLANAGILEEDNE